MDQLELQTVWDKFYENKDKLSKNKLVEHYFITLVQRIAKSLSKEMNNKISKEELASLGVDGLLRSLDKYDRSRKIKFETYAHRRIKGSMIDGLRACDWVPRSVRIRQNKLEAAKHKVEGRIGRKAMNVEILNEIGISENDYCKAPKKYNAVICSSIDTCINQEVEIDDNKKDFNKYLVAKNSPTPYAKLVRKEFLSKLLNNQFDSLERQIIYYYYYEDLTMKEISQKVDMSESRISQIHQTILKRLKSVIKNDKEFFTDDVLGLIVSSNHKDNLF